MMMNEADEITATCLLRYVKHSIIFINFIAVWSLENCEFCLCKPKRQIMIAIKFTGELVCVSFLKDEK